MEPVDARDVLSLIGNTPLVKLARIGREVPHVELYAKAEWFNPGGSVKDRAAKGMVLGALKSGALRPGMTILDATSGNTGIGLGMIGATLGHPVTVCLPKNASEERKRILRAYGVRIVYTTPLDGTDGAQREAKRLAAADPDTYWYADQYNNPDNVRAHYETTGPEIWRQSHGRVTHFVAGVGTSGTLMGAGRALRERNPNVRIIAFQPDGPFHGMEGLKHMESALVPGIYDSSFPDEQWTVSTEEAQAYVRRLAREEGLLVGTSSGAALAVSLKVARAIERGVVVTIFPDGGDKYLGEAYWEG
ncbi:MAG: cysteine synthase family protein [Euryarchaeota archaeon]|nr:cysteine synthase family protein [Euryarchaeota archaeon]